MSGETYELRLDPEGFQIVPVGSEQLAVQILPGPAGEKALPSALFLSTEASQKLVVAGGTETAALLDGHKTEAAIPVFHKEENLQYGETWFPDLLASLGNLPASMMDLPVFCSDGLAWPGGGVQCRAVP